MIKDSYTIFNIKINPKVPTLTKYISTLIYILLILYHKIENDYIHNILNDILSILYGVAWVLFICGLLINNVYHKELMKKHNLNRRSQIFGDIFGHILPLILIYNYGPRKTRVKLSHLLILVASFILLFGNYFTEVYVGVPPFIILILAPLIILFSFYYRFK
tara:strand:- start:1332 stop:1817 length:486 start_codon:yes stop_codon:yes gene_type:complete